VTGTGQNQMIVGKCIADGTNLEGASCTQTPVTNGIPTDDCKAGFYCTSTGNNVAAGTGTQPVCRKLCTATNTCTGQQQCANFFGGDYGACLPTCTVFGTTCGSGYDCGFDVETLDSTMQTPKGMFICKKTGAGGVFADCQRNADCGANMWCDPPAQGGNGCTPECDGTHACPSVPGDGGGALSCQSYTNTNGAGYCG
jgi:hypothetical protein